MTHETQNGDAIVVVTAAKTCAAFAVTLRQPASVGGELGNITSIDAGWQIEWIGAPARDWEAIAQALWEPDGDQRTANAHRLSHSDAAAETHAFAAFVGDCLVGALIVQPTVDSIGRDWLIARLGTVLGPSERFRLLAGRPSGVLSPRGPTVCFCCDVGRNDIVDAVRAGCSSMAMVSEKTRAGSNCGVCRPNVARVIHAALSVASDWRTTAPPL